MKSRQWYLVQKDGNPKKKCDEGKRAEKIKYIKVQNS
jgi:hypothetical protein